MLALNFDPFPLLRTDRLVLRKIEDADVNEIFFLRSDEEVMKYIGRPRAQSMSEALTFIETIREQERNGDCVTWAITFSDSPTLIGTICYWHIAKEHYRAEVGYVLHPRHQCKGIMQETLTAVLDYGFTTMGLHSVEANVDPDNASSIRLLERNKFIREAYFRENFFYDGKFYDSAVYSLLSPIR